MVQCLRKLSHVGLFGTNLFGSESGLVSLYRISRNSIQCLSTHTYSLPISTSQQHTSVTRVYTLTSMNTIHSFSRHCTKMLCPKRPYNTKRSFACPALHWLVSTPEEGLDQAETSRSDLIKEHLVSTYLLHALPFSMTIALHWSLVIL